MKSVRLFYSILFCLLFYITILHSQKITSEQIEALPIYQVADSSQPVIYGDNFPDYPDSILVQGTIEEVTFVRAGCGVMCWNGSAKIKLIKNVEGYSQDFVFLIIPCFTGNNTQYIGKNVQINAHLLKEDKLDSCKTVFNEIDSKGIPFYLIINANF
jgi:hypothetical protein